jgi:ADP-ribose pyrophosphatase
MNLKLLKRSNPYRGRVFNVIVDDVEYPSGNASVREVAEHSGGAVVLARFPDDTILLVRQHRYPFDAFIWELPAGKLNTGEDPLHCAQRELEEETGYHAAEWRKLTAIYTSPGFCSEVLHIYLATDLKEAPGGRKLEEGELTMTMTRLPLSESIAMVERNEIVDGKTICGLLLGERIVRKEKP